MRRIRRAFAIVVLLSALSGGADANNNLFLPGDAFFPTRLTAEGLAKLRDQPAGTRQFVYSSLGGYSPAFCGYAGYVNAEIPAVDDEFLAMIEAVFRETRRWEPRLLREDKSEDGKTIKLVETNPIGVLFYPEAMPKSFVIGLRYNENWVEESMKFGHRREHLRLCCLAPDPRAMMLSWRDAKAMPRLPASLPNVELTAKGAKKPIVVEGFVQAIVIGTSTPLELYKTGEDDLTSIITIKRSGIRELRNVYGEKKSLEWSKESDEWRAPTESDWLDDDELF